MHLHFHEIPLSTVRLSETEASGEVGLSYGFASSTCRHRLPADHNPIARFFAPRPSAHRAAPPRRGPATSAA
jgi:hypothetical protein